MSKILVLDAQMRNSLAIIRSLGKAGLTVTAAEDTRFATGMFSKYCAEKIVYPSPKSPDFTDFLLDEVKKNQYDMVIPVTDSTLVPIVRRKEEFSRYTIVPTPEFQTVEMAEDKGTTLKIAINAGVPCPKTYFVNDDFELDEIIKDIELPVIIKPRIGYGSRGIALCRTLSELKDNYRKISSVYERPLIQEYIPSGGEMGVYALFNFNSDPRAVCVQKRLRSYPISGGPSTYRESIDNPELISIATKLLKELKWTGVAMVEFRVDRRDGVPKLMEINPRFWGSLQLSILSGIDFPYLLYCLYTKGDIGPVLNYKKGIRCRWILPGDILWYLGSHHKLRNLPELFRLDNDDIISIDDPGPTLGFTLAAMRYMFDANMWKFIIKKPLGDV